MPGPEARERRKHRANGRRGTRASTATSSNMRTSFTNLLLFLLAIPLISNAVVLPCELQGKCKITAADFFLTDYDFGNMTVEDSLGKKLYFHFDGEPDGNKIWYGSSWKDRVQSVAGGRQENALLKLLQQILTEETFPVPNPHSTIALKRKYWNYTYAAHFIKILERRCK
jgi:hypothetical protein